MKLFSAPALSLPRISPGVRAECLAIAGLIGSVALVFGYGYAAYNHRPYLLGTDVFAFILSTFVKPLWSTAVLGPVHSPLQGAGGDIFLPTNVPFVPQLLPALLVCCNLRVALPLIFTLAATLLALSTYGLARSLYVSRGMAVAAAWLAPLLALWVDELTYAGPQYLHGPTMSNLILMLLALTGRGGLTHNLLTTSGFVLASLAFAVSDINILILATPVLVVVGAAVLLSCRSRREVAWKLGAVGAAGMIAAATGVLGYAVTLTSGTARFLFADELTQAPQSLFTRGRLFALDPTAAIIVVLFLAGTVWAIWRGNRPMRSVGVSALVLTALACVSAFLFGHTDFRWTAPSPGYFHHTAYPVIALFAVQCAHPFQAVVHWLGGRLWTPPGRPAKIAGVIIGGLAGIAMLAAGGRLALSAPPVSYLATVISPDLYQFPVWSVALMLTGAAVLAQVIGRHRVELVGAGLAVWLLTLQAPMHLPPPGLAGQDSRLFGGIGLEATPVHVFLRERVALHPGGRFNGYVDTYFPSGKPVQSVTLETVTAWGDVLADHRNLHTAYGLWAFDLPTVSQVSSYITPIYYQAFTRLLNNPDEYQGAAILTITRPNVAALRMSGVRYLLTRGEVLGREAQLPAGVRQVLQWEMFRVYEIEQANIANYSPAAVRRVADGREALDLLDEPTFDPTQTALVMADVPDLGGLTPVTRSEMRFVAGGIHVSAESAGRTLLVLPIQFNRCMSVRVVNGDRAARLVRVNLFQTGLLFDQSVVLDASYDDGGLAARCAIAERDDAVQLGLGSLTTPRRLPEWTLPGLEHRWRLFDGTQWSAITVPAAR